jgi:hypothetical protein
MIGKFIKAILAGAGTELPQEREGSRLLYLLRWPNGEHRVLDPSELRASDWLRYVPAGSLASIPLRHDVGAPIDARSETASVTTPFGARMFLNDAFDIASDAPPSEVNTWMPPDFELIRAEGDGPVQPAVSAALAATDTARAHRAARNLRRLMHYDEDDL